MLQGRTVDQKRKIAQRITDAMVEEAGARRDAIVVTFLEVSKESYASGGELRPTSSISSGECPAGSAREPQQRCLFLRFAGKRVRATLAQRFV